MRRLSTRLPLLVPTSVLASACGLSSPPSVVVEDGDTIVTVGSSCCEDDAPCADDTGEDDDDGWGVVIDTAPPIGACDDFPEPSLYDVELLEECAYDPTPVDIVFAPEVEWEWAPTDGDHPFNEVMMTPVVGNLTDDNGDGLINDNDTPDVVFAAYRNPSYGATYGALVMLSGDDGSELLYQTTITLADGSIDYPSSRAGVALADIDSDGTPEACFTTALNRLICMTAAGSVTLVGSAPSDWSSNTFQGAKLSIADMDGDGSPEIAAGRAVYNADGTLRFVGVGDNGGPAYMGSSFMADLYGDGTMELIAGSTVYDHTGATLWDSGDDGFAGIADFNLDGSAELVVIHNRALSIYDSNGSVLVNQSFAADCGSAAYCGGPPTLADFDGDGLPEIGVSGAYSYTVWDFDFSTGSLTQLWQNATQDASSGATGSSVFDFEDDGIAEVVFADEERFYVWRGTDGSDQLGSAGLDPEQHASGTGLEYPSLADVDNDGSTEIILASNRLWESAGTTDWFGVRSIGSGSGDAWAGSRPVWNQHAYHMANIEDDLSVPSPQDQSWTANNTFRAAQNTSIDDIPGAPQSDLVVMEAFDWCQDCDENTIEIWFGVANQGLEDAAATTASFVNVDGVLMDVDLPALASGASTVVGPVVLPMGAMQSNLNGLELIVDVPDSEDECDETNNSSDRLSITISSECE